MSSNLSIWRRSNELLLEFITQIELNNLNNAQ